MDQHHRWAADIEGTSDGRTGATNATVRAVFIVGADKRIKLMLTYPMTTGRNFDEILRVLDSLQLTAKHKVATPVSWQPGDDVIIAGSVSDEDAKTMFPAGWKAPKPYLRITQAAGLSPALLPQREVRHSSLRRAPPADGPRRPLGERHVPPLLSVMLLDRRRDWHRIRGNLRTRNDAKTGTFFN